MTGYRVFNFRVHSPTWVDFWLFIDIEVQLLLFVKRFCFRFYITGYRVFNFWFLSPTWVDFWLIIASKSNQCFLLNIFCFRFIWRTSCVQHIDFIPQRGLTFDWLWRWSSINAFSAWDMPSSLSWSRLVTAVLYLCRGTALPSPCTPDILN